MSIIRQNLTLTSPRTINYNIQCSTDIEIVMFCGKLQFKYLLLTDSFQENLEKMVSSSLGTFISFM